MVFKRAFKWIPILALLAAAPVFAHHGTTGADTRKVVTLHGVVTKTSWTNPHVVLHVDVKDADGKVVNWAVSVYPPNTLRRMGVTQDSLPLGSEVTVEAYLYSDGSHNATSAGMLTLPDGKRINQPVSSLWGAGSAIVYRPDQAK